LIRFRKDISVRPDGHYSGMTSFVSSAKALWLLWDGRQQAVLGRSDGRVIELTPRLPDCETFVVRTLSASGDPADLLDFFWVKRNRAFVRPLLLPSSARSIEVAAVAGSSVTPIARYRFEDVQDPAALRCDVVSTQVQPGAVPTSEPALVGSQSGFFAEAERWLAPLKRNRAHAMIWAVAAPFEDLGGSNLLERRVGPLSTLFPRRADLIMVKPVRYRKEEESEETPRQSDEHEPAIRSVARELRHVISLEVDAPLSESESGAVPGLVVFHYMRQRRLIQQWQATTSLLRFTTADLERLDGATYPFVETNRDFAVRPLRASDGFAEGLQIRARDQQSGDTLVRRFTISFVFASLGDLLIVCDMAAERLVGQDGAACRSASFVVGPAEIKRVYENPLEDERLVKAALEVVEPGYEARRRPGPDEPNQVLHKFLAAQIQTSAFDAADIASQPLLPLFATAYAAHARQAPEIAKRIDYSTFARDPGVGSAAFLTPVSAAAARAGAPRRRHGASQRFFSLRLEGELGVSASGMPPADLEADILAVDLLTNQTNRPSREYAPAAGVRIDAAHRNSGAVAQLNQPPRILVVDDNATNREILDTRLEASGFRVLHAADGEEALTAVRRDVPDLVLLDVMMPKVGGIEVCRRIKADRTLPYIPIIMVGAKSESSDVVAGIDAGADEFLAKPVDQLALIARIKALLRAKARYDLEDKAPPPREDRTDLFVSYARADAAKIEKLVTRIQRHGWTVWWDRHIEAGRSFDRVIERALENAKTVIVAWSANSVNSDWVRAEAAFALQQNKLVPVRLDNASLPLRYINLQAIDLSRWTGGDDDEAFLRLLSAIDGLLSKGHSTAT
jgi:DNA-binding response OmpR family regulator